MNIGGAVTQLFGQVVGLDIAVEIGFYLTMVAGIILSIGGLVDLGLRGSPLVAVKLKTIPKEEMSEDEIKKRIQELTNELGKRKEKEKALKLQYDPLTILKIRYAKGEVSKEEYEEMKKTLEE